MTPWFAALLLLGLGAVALERVGRLPEPLPAVVRAVEEPLAALLREIGLELPGQPSQPGESPSSRPSDDAAEGAKALALLDRILVEAERPRGFDRDDWPHWVDANGDCQDTRQEVLAAESQAPVHWDGSGCDVLSGLWRDLYTGETFLEPGALDVDHLVPLAEAFRSGGRGWDVARRAAYANDLGDGRTLIAVSASANRSKGDKGPEDWLPPEGAYRCRYVADWVAVKLRWSLSMDERERVTVGNVLLDCARG